MTKPNHPTSQPSGKTILVKAVSDYHIEIERYFSELDSGLPHSAVIDKAERQLFDAMMEMLGDYEAYNSNIDLNVSKTQKYIKEKTGEITGRNSLRHKMEKQLRLFFNQPEASEKP